MIGVVERMIMNEEIKQQPPGGRRNSLGWEGCLKRGEGVNQVKVQRREIQSV